MFKNMSLRVKLLVIGITLSAIPLITVMIIVDRQNSSVIAKTAEVSNELGVQGLDYILRVVVLSVKGAEASGMNNIVNGKSVHDNLLNQLKQIKVGESGYVYIIKASGENQGNYVLSKDRERDGENIWDSRDEQGNYFVRSICSKATQLGSNDIAEERYPWKNQGDVKARVKIARIAYVKSLDWAIAAGAYQDEFEEGVNFIRAFGQKNMAFLIGLTVGALALIVVVWIVMANSLTSRINRTARDLAEGAEQTASAAGQVSAASQSLANGANKQAAAVEETSSSLEEMTSMTKRNSENAEEAKKMSDGVSAKAEEGLSAVDKMSTAVAEIKKASDETTKIVKNIDDIAFQTNLLALNAAVEAARAGEAGKGFAVVAEEVRNLAMRSAEAAKNTANLLKESSQKTELGVAISQNVMTTFKEIHQGARKVNELVTSIAMANSEQAQGIEQMNISMSQVDSTTQANASVAEEAASTAEELNSQVEMLREIVVNLNEIVGAAMAANQRQTAARSTRETIAPKPAHKLTAPVVGQPVEHAAAKKVAAHQQVKIVTHHQPQAGAKETAAAHKPEEVIPFGDEETLTKF